ncbi:hypothetical protein BHM03_00028008 [Ensete ventricosum]|nr:hypothetical protein BHM03_00028008 [Ensete ventricosum]
MYRLVPGTILYRDNLDTPVQTACFPDSGQISPNVLSFPSPPSRGHLLGLPHLLLFSTNSRIHPNIGAQPLSQEERINTTRTMPNCRKQSRNNFETGWIASSTVGKERLRDRQHSNSSPVAGGLVSPRTSTCGERRGEIAPKSFHLRRELPAAEAVQTPTDG